MKNPFVEWRENKSLSRRKTALLASMDYAQLAATELGLVNRPHRSLLVLVRQLDGDDVATALEEAFQSWKETEARIALAQLVGS